MGCGRNLIILLLLVFGWLNTPAQLTYQQLLVQYDSAWTFKNLQLIPIRFKGNPPEGLQKKLLNNSISLTDALNKGKVKIKELYYDNGADVNWLSLTNKTRQTLVVNSGELLAGGKQDRMVGETKIIPPGQSDYVKVYCVEKGRWDDKAKGFAPGGNADVELKKVMDLTRRQADVWKEIERQFGLQKRQTVTWPYLELSKRPLKEDSLYLAYFTKRFQQSDSVYAGFLTITGNVIINCELFAAPELTVMAYPAMVKGLLYFAMENETPTVAMQAKQRFMDQLLKSEEAQKTFVEMHGHFHEYLGRVVHLVAYGD